MYVCHIVQLVETAENSGDFKPVIHSFGSVWDNPDALQMSFLKNPKNIQLDGTDTGLDFEQVSKAYEIIKRLVREHVSYSNTFSQKMYRE